MDDLLSRATELDLTADDAWTDVQVSIVASQLALLRGHVEDAKRSLRHGEKMARRLGAPFEIACVLLLRATACLLDGQPDRTRALLTEAVELSARSRVSYVLAYTLPALAGFVAHHDDPAVAARLFGASASYTSLHSSLTNLPPLVGLARSGLDRARTELGADTFAMHWRAGRDATLDGIADLAASIRHESAREPVPDGPVRRPGRRPFALER